MSAAYTTGDFDYDQIVLNIANTSVFTNIRISGTCHAEARVLADSALAVLPKENDTSFKADTTELYEAFSGTYQATTKDMNQVITANITCDFRSTVILRGLGSALLQIRTSQDGTTWAAWQDFKPAQYTFRYLDARVLLATEDPTNTPEVNHISLRIDVPDTDKAGSIVIPVGGATVNYGHVYYELPVLTPMAIGDNRFPVILIKTKTNFTAKITDRAGTDTGGTLDWRTKGY
jgi:hypothetical protein